MAKKLDYRFIPMPSVIIDEALNMGGSELLLLMWLIRISQRGVGMTFADDEILHGIFIKAVGHPPKRIMVGCNISRGALKSARSKLQENGFILVKKVSRYDNIYSLTISSCDSAAQTVTEVATPEDARLYEVEKEVESTEELFRLEPGEVTQDVRKRLHADIKRHIMAIQKQITGLACPWDAACGKQLDSIIRANPDWTIDNWCYCVNMRFQSEDCVASQSPKVWLPKLGDYAVGPLDKFHKPLRAAVSKEDERDRERTESSRRILAEAGARLGAGATAGDGVSQKTLGRGEETLRESVGE